MIERIKNESAGIDFLNESLIFTCMTIAPNIKSAKSGGAP